MPDANARILLVDDSEDDRLLMIRSLKKSSPEAEIITAEDGIAALKFIDNHAATHPPSVVLLDLNMPKVDGFEVLSRIRANSATKNLPVVVLTTSNEACDVKRSYELGANSFVRKPVDSREYARTISQLKSYWLINNLVCAATSGSN